MSDLINLVDDGVGLVLALIGLAGVVTVPFRWAANSYLDRRVENGVKAGVRPVITAIEKQGDTFSDALKDLTSSVTSLAHGHAEVVVVQRQQGEEIAVVRADVNNLGEKVHKIDKEVGQLATQSNTVLKIFGGTK